MVARGDSIDALAYSPDGGYLVAGKRLIPLTPKLPALALPCGFGSDGLPVSLQLTGRPFDEATVLRAGYAYEQATPWHTRRPGQR